VPYFYIALSLVPVWLGSWRSTIATTTESSAPDSTSIRGSSPVVCKFFAAIAVLDFALKLDIARAFVLIAIPLAVLLSIATRFGLRKGLHALKPGANVCNAWSSSDFAPVEQVERQLARAPWSGFQVVTTYTNDRGSCEQLAISIGPGHLERHRSRGCSRHASRRCSDHRERKCVRAERVATVVVGTRGLGIDLIAARRSSTSPDPNQHRQVADLPLLHVERPAVQRRRGGLQGGLRPMLRLVSLALLSPLLFATAVQ